MKNAKQVVLPLREPLLSTYHYEGSICAILDKNPSIENWYLNKVVSLRCNRKFIGNYTTPEVSVWNASFFENPYIERITFPLKYLGNHYHDIIRALINDRYYIFFSAIDDFFIEGKSWYNERHFLHDALVFGYDQTDKTYHMYAYDLNWRYSTFKTSQKGVDAAKKAALKVWEGSVFYAIKPINDYIELDESQMLSELERYLDSSWENFPPTCEDFAYGAIVHDYINVYLYKQSIEAFPYDRIDRRIFRALWEHKRLMLKRIQAFEEKLQLGKECSELYAPLVAEANSMRMLYASHTLKRRDSILPALQKRVLNLKEQEQIILERFIKRIKEKPTHETMEKNAS